MCFSSTVVDSVGYCVDRTIVQVMDPKHQIMQEVCLHVKLLSLILPEHWLSSKQTKLSSKITCLSLTLLICWCVCVFGCLMCVSHVHPVLIKCRRSLVPCWRCMCTRRRSEKARCLISDTSNYGLTGSVFACNWDVVRKSMGILRHAAGNFYINDKSMGSVVGQQPLGGPGLQVGGSRWMGLQVGGSQWVGL